MALAAPASAAPQRRRRGDTFRQAIVDTNYDFPATLTTEKFRLNSYPQLTYDRLNGKLTVVWSDDRNGHTTRPPAGPSGRTVTMSSVQFITVNRDGTEVQGVFIGDYSAVSISSDLRIHPCWTDFRGRAGVNAPNQGAYTQSIQLKS